MRVNINLLMNSNESVLSTPFIPQKVLVQRAAEYAALDTSRLTEQWSEDEWIMFKLGNETFVISLLQLDEIADVSNGVILPHSAPEIIGLMNLRAEIILLVDLAKLLNISSFEAIDGSLNLSHKINQQVLILKDQQGNRTGFLINQIKQAQVFGKDFFEKKLHAGANGRKAIIDATGDLQGKNINRINVDALLASVKELF